MFESNNNLAPYVIAEIGVNHEGNINLAKEMIRQVADAGAQCAKFQSYKADKIAALDSPSYWDLKKESTRSQYELFQKYDSFGMVEYKELKEECDEVGVDFITTPFDLEVVDHLNSLQKFYKVASADITNLPLLKKISEKNKTIVMSTGASALDEIEFAIKCLKRNGCSNEIVLLHCILNYPTLSENAQIGFIRKLGNTFPNNRIGYSCHVVPEPTFSAQCLAMDYGASIIEKHFTHDKSLPGNDHYHAFDYTDLKNFMDLIDYRKKLIGSESEKKIENEVSAIKHARRSLYFNKYLKASHKISSDDLICLRPGTGVSPVEWDNIMGKELKHDVNKNQKLSLNDIKSSQEEKTII